MFKKSILSLLMIFGIGFPLMAMQEAIIDNNNVRVEMIKNQESHNNYLDSRDQGLKYLAILLPTAIVGATILKSWKGNLSEQGGWMAFFGGGIAGVFSVFMTVILGNEQSGRNAANTKLREELTKIGTSK